MDQIIWGIIGCGNVTEVKSGPAFKRVPNSSLAAVMRRDKVQAEDYARRHHVKKWNSDADELIHDQEINAIYIATPPDTHEEYTFAAFKAGKSVYVEKPMALDSVEALRMQEAAEKYSCKLSVAHYRRAQPRFIEIKRLIREKIIGNTISAEISFRQAHQPGTENTWRAKPEISGGGFFHDLAPHQLDLMLYFFGEPQLVTGSSSSRNKNYSADDHVIADITFGKDVTFKGLWDFNASPEDEADLCVITGTKGIIRFPIFSDSCELTLEGQTKKVPFDPIQHVQQPMIEQVVNYFLDKGPNPCSAEDAVKVMKMMDKIVGKINLKMSK